MTSKTVSYSNRDKRKFLIRCLEYMKHAEHCQRGEVKDPIFDSCTVNRCRNELCNYVDLVLSHQTLMSCKLNSLCDISGCYSSFKTFLHCKKCTASDCFICPLIKGKKYRISQTSNADLDSKCGVDFEERSTQTGTSGNTVTVATQTDEIISDVSPVKKVKEAVQKVCLPQGLIIEKVELKSKTEDEKASLVSSELRVTQVKGFVKTIIGKCDVVTILDKKLLFLIKYITKIEENIYNSANSKEEYLKALLERIREINLDFMEYKGKQKHSLVQDAAQFYFKNKVIEMFGSDEIDKIILPPGEVMLKLGEPISAKGAKKFQKLLTPSDREKSIFKMFLDGLKNEEWGDIKDISIFCDSILLILDYYCRSEESLYKTAYCREDYYHLVKNDQTETEYRIYKMEKKDIKVETENKPYSENYNNLIKQFPERKITEILDNKIEKNSEDDLKVNSVKSVFCYSHFLLLTYSVSYQLWKKFEEKESEAKASR